MAVAADAITSANRFASAGKSQAGIKPSTSTYLSDAARKVMTGAASRVTATATASAGAAAADAVATPECTVALTCNRERSNAGRAELDAYGLVAFVCIHTIPCLDLAVVMNAPEQHSFYERALEYILQRRPDLKFMYLDLMCRFHAKVALMIKDLEERKVLAPGECDPALLLPWMHSFDHNVACQLGFGPLYHEGAGRRHGEQTEQLWSLLKPYAKIARYMAWHHFWDGINMVFTAITLRAQASFPATLRGRLKHTVEKLGERIGQHALVLIISTSLTGAHRQQVGCRAPRSSLPSPRPSRSRYFFFRRPHVRAQPAERGGRC